VDCCLLNSKKKDDKEPIVIPRDGKVFKYVLEYLTYGALLSEISEGMLRKLVIDADFYLLPQLKEQASNLLKEGKKDREESKKILYKAQSTTYCGNGGIFNWNLPTSVPASHFDHGDQTITIKQEGTYQVIVRYAFQCSTHGSGSANIDLIVSGSVVARNYHGQNDGYQQSRSLTEVLTLKANDRIQVRYYSNSNSLSDQYATAITILLL